jgi:hypothetical protein
MMLFTSKVRKSISYSEIETLVQHRTSLLPSLRCRYYSLHREQYQNTSIIVGNQQWVNIRYCK